MDRHLWIGTCGSELVEAAWCNLPELVKAILQSGSAGHEPSISCEYKRQDLEAALLASVQQGHCEVLDRLQEACTRPGRAARVLSIGESRIELRTASLSMSPLHLALDRFRSRDVGISKRIVTSLAAHGAILFAEVKEVLHEWIDMGRLYEEDRVWLLQLFPAYVTGPPHVMFLSMPEDMYSSSGPRFLMQDLVDSDDAVSLDAVSFGSSVSGSTEDSFVSAKES